jgi:hypothetical protein
MQTSSSGEETASETVTQSGDAGKYAWWTFRDQESQMSMFNENSLFCKALKYLSFAVTGLLGVGFLVGVVIGVTATESSTEQVCADVTRLHKDAVSGFVPTPDLQRAAYEIYRRSEEIPSIQEPTARLLRFLQPDRRVETQDDLVDALNKSADSFEQFSAKMNKQPSGPAFFTQKMVNECSALMKDVK